MIDEQAADTLIESKKPKNPTYGYYLIYGVKGTAIENTVWAPRQVFFPYLKAAKDFVAGSLTTDHQVISLIRGKAVKFRIESRLTV